MMFEQTLEEMVSVVIIESAAYQMVTASNVGASYELIFEGSHAYTYQDAREIVAMLDRILVSCPKHLQRKIRAMRNQFVFTFGPKMEALCGRPPDIR